MRVFLRLRLIVFPVALWAVYRAWELRWVCDDAFISFRYARNFVRGLGLVYNAGEHVEGYTNFLWTLLLTPAFLVPAWEVEFLSEVLGILFYAASLLLLYFFLPRGALPVAFVAHAFFFHAQLYATSGLETSLYLFLVTAVVLSWFRARDRLLSPVGYLLIGLACLTRPDGILLFLAACVRDLLIILRMSLQKHDRGMLQSTQTLRAKMQAAIHLLVDCAKYSYERLALRQLGFWLLVGGHIGFRLSYYGYFLPNTYYAKSGSESYWMQGLRFAWLFFSSYYVIGLALAFVLFWQARLFLAASKEKTIQITGRGASVLAALFFIFGHLLYYLRVGGGFMFARLLLPLVPVLWILLELSLRELVARYRHLRFLPALVVCLLVCGLLLRYDPYKGLPVPVKYGVSDEHKFYQPSAVRELKAKALRLRPYFQTARIAIGGAQAMLAYYLDPPFVLEAATGLTDEYLAHQRLKKRGRIGHEKRAPLSYLQKRRVHLHLLPPPAFPRREYNRFVMPGFAFAEMRIVVYERSVMDRFPQPVGFRFMDFPKYLDAYIQRQLPRRNKAELERDFQEFKEYYFRWNQDFERESVFQRALKKGLSYKSAGSSEMLMRQNENGR